MLNLIFSSFLFLTGWIGQGHGAFELEVPLPTVRTVPSLYLTRLHTEETVDWRHIEELWQVLSYDLSHSGLCSVLKEKPDFEKQIFWKDPRGHFDLSFWRREKITFVVGIEASNGLLSAIAFKIDQGTSKRYPEVLLTGNTQQDRRAIHRLADTIQKDLFGIEGISSLRILYAKRTKNLEPHPPEWLSDIWTSDWDGANARQLTSQSYCVTPFFFPKTLSQKEGSYGYVSNEKGQSKIYRSSLQELQGQVWIHLRGNQMLPAISRTGTQLAFITDAAGRPDLFLQSIDTCCREIGKPRQIFSAPRATQASPTFSPDEKKVAFVSDKDGTPRIYVLEIKDPRDTRRSLPKLISRKNRENTAPSWSPDGKKLAYSARVEGVRQIWIYDFETEEEFQLTFGADNKENPTWAPNNLHLLYNTETHDISELFVINLNQKQPVQISSGFGQKRFGAWETR